MKILGIRKQESQAIVQFLCMNLRLAVLVEIRRDRRTEGHSIYRTTVASHSENLANANRTSVLGTIFHFYSTSWLFFLHMLEEAQLLHTKHVTFCVMVAFCKQRWAVSDKNKLVTVEYCWWYCGTLHQCSHQHRSLPQMGINFWRYGIQFSTGQKNAILLTHLHLMCSLEMTPWEFH